MTVYSNCDFLLSSWQQRRFVCCKFLSLLRHSGFLPLCLGKSFVVVSVGLAPFVQFCRPVTMYSSLLLCLRRHARCFDFHVSLNVVVDNSFWHVFERDAVVRPLCPLANPLCGCFCLGSCPFCVSGLLFFFDETQIWLGDLRVVWLVCVVFGLL